MTNYPHAVRFKLPDANTKPPTFRSSSSRRASIPFLRQPSIVAGKHISRDLPNLDGIERSQLFAVASFLSRPRDCEGTGRSDLIVQLVGANNANDASDAKTDGIATRFVGRRCLRYGYTEFHLCAVKNWANWFLLDRLCTPLPPVYLPFNLLCLLNRE